MQTVTRETPYPSRRAFCCGLGAALALPMVDVSVLAQAPAAQEAAGPPMLPLRSPGLEHLGLTGPDPEAAAKFYGRIFGPQLFREREAPPRYYVMAGTAHLAFGGSDRQQSHRWSITSVRSSTTIADARCVPCSRREASSPLASA